MEIDAGYLTVTFALLLVCTGASQAQTPDGETPAEETVGGESSTPKDKKERTA